MSFTGDIKKIAEHWRIVWKIIAALVLAVFFATRLYASINNRLDGAEKQISCINQKNVTRDSKISDITEAIARQETHYEHISKSLDRIESKIEKLENPIIISDVK